MSLSWISSTITWLMPRIPVSTFLRRTPKAETAGKCWCNSSTFPLPAPGLKIRKCAGCAAPFPTLPLYKWQQGHKALPQWETLPPSPPNAASPSVFWGQSIYGNFISLWHYFCALSDLLADLSDFWRKILNFSLHNGMSANFHPKKKNPSQYSKQTL